MNMCFWLYFTSMLTQTVGVAAKKSSISAHCIMTVSQPWNWTRMCQGTHSAPRRQSLQPWNRCSPSMGSHDQCTSWSLSRTHSLSLSFSPPPPPSPLSLSLDPSLYFSHISKVCVQDWSICADKQYDNSKNFKGLGVRFCFWHETLHGSFVSSTVSGTLLFIIIGTHVWYMYTHTHTHTHARTF